MMSPHTEANDTDSRHTVHHTLPTEYVTKRARDKTEDGQDNNVDFRMTEEPEQVLLENRITTEYTVIHTGSIVTVNEQTSNCNTQHRK
jgi:hypothetical protein